MKNNLLNSVIWRIVYLTPFGYILKLFHLQTGEYTPGVYIVLEKKSPVQAVIKNNLLKKERIELIVSGVSLITQSMVISMNKLGNGWGEAYAWTAMLYGFVAMITGLKPDIDWNDRNNFLRISLVEVWLIFCLLITVILKDLLGYFNLR